MTPSHPHFAPIRDLWYHALSSPTGLAITVDGMVRTWVGRFSAVKVLLGDEDLEALSVVVPKEGEIWLMKKGLV